MKVPLQLIRNGVIACCLAGGLLLAILGGALHQQTPDAVVPTDTPLAQTWPEPVASTADDWQVMQKRGTATQSAVGPLAQRYRLAGTFFAYPGDSQEAGDSSRHAILDDIQMKKQHLVQEDDDVDGNRVLSIFRDRIVLRHAGGDEELWLSFSGRGKVELDAPSSTAEAEQPLTFDEMPALETSRFGKRIGDNRWILQREALMDYLHEIQEDPERLSSVLLALQPEYEGDAVGGFKLRLLGEDILYEAAGFQEGDIVRMVNSMPMTSAARANYFISEFLNERISAVVFDIERNGAEEKLIYLLR